MTHARHHRFGHSATAHAFAACAVAFVSGHAIAADGSFRGTITPPQQDRWMYPFNTTRGTRPTASTFGSTSGEPDFDNRDAQIVLKFGTAALVPQASVATGCVITHAVLTLEVANDLVFAYDPTPDPWQAFLPATDQDWVVDADAGQPVECYGTGFRNGWSPTSWQESSPFCPPSESLLAPGVRNAYAAEATGGSLADVSNTVRERRDAAPFATGTVDGLVPGALVPAGRLMRFDLRVDDPSVQAYLVDGLAQGSIFLTVASLTRVEVMGGSYPLFIMKEHALVQLGLASAPALELVVEALPPCVPADLDCSGSVDGTDLGLLLGQWGTSSSADLSGDGTVDGTDLGLLLGAWG